MSQRVLLVEDDASDADLLLHFMRRAGPEMTVVHCRTLAEAFATPGSFDCCLLDLSLPDSQGLVTVQRFQKHSRTPVVVLTSQSDPEMGTEAIRIGADDYIEKGSTSPSALRRVLEYTVERGRLRRRLELAQRSFGAIVERSPNGLMVVQRGRVAFMNARARELFDGLDVGANYPYGLDAREVSQGRRILNLTSSATDWQDGPAQLVVCADVTARRAEDERLRHRESLLQKAQRTKALGRLAGGMAHEFNNALTTVTGHAELLRAAHGELVEGQVVPILAAADHMRALNAQILALSPQPVRELARVHINDAVESARPLLARALREGVELENDLAADAGLAMFPEGELGRVLLELVANASQAGATKVTVRTRRAANLVELTVLDNGEGMSSVVREQALEPFYSARGATGLGLASVYGVVKAAEGMLALTSVEGAGCQVRMALPRVEPVDLPEMSLHAGTILLVDDDAFVRELAEQILVRGGHMVLAAASAEEALTIREPIDLLVTDMVMPGLGGADLYRQLHVSLRGLPAVFMSGYSERDLPEEAAGHSVFLQKPFRPAALLAAVQQLLPR